MLNSIVHNNLWLVCRVIGGGGDTGNLLSSTERFSVRVCCNISQMTS